MVLKLKVFLSGNYESKLLRKKIEKILNDKYYDVVDFHNYCNYVLDAINLSKIVKDNASDSVGFLFCNYGQNLSFALGNDVKNVVINKGNRLKQTTYLNTNVLIFSIKELSEEEIIKTIIYYLDLFERGICFFH